jgi:mutator protein MutT
LRAIEVVCGIVLSRSRLLVTKRLPDDDFAELWEFPGGKIEAGEDASGALVRELREELQIECRVGAHWGVLSAHHGKVPIRLHVYFAEIESGTPETIACQEYRWVDPPELGQLEFLEADKVLVKELERTYRDDLPLDSARQRPAFKRKETR